MSFSPLCHSVGILLFRALNAHCFSLFPFPLVPPLPSNLPPNHPPYNRIKRKYPSPRSNQQHFKSLPGLHNKTLGQSIKQSINTIIFKFERIKFYFCFLFLFFKRYLEVGKNWETTHLDKPIQGDSARNSLFLGRKTMSHNLIKDYSESQWTVKLNGAPGSSHLTVDSWTVLTVWHVKDLDTQSIAHQPWANASQTLFSSAGCRSSHPPAMD